MLINLDSVIHKVYILLEEDHYKNSGWAVEKWNDEIVCTTDVDVRADSHKLEKKERKKLRKTHWFVPHMAWSDVTWVVWSCLPDLSHSLTTVDRCQHQRSSLKNPSLTPCIIHVSFCHMCLSLFVPTTHCVSMLSVLLCSIKRHRRAPTPLKTMKTRRTRTKRRWSSRL